MKSFLINTLKFNFSVVFLVSCISEAAACSSCFYGDPNQQALIAAKWGIATLFIVLLGVLGTIIKFLISFSKRSKHLMEMK